MHHIRNVLLVLGVIIAAVGVVIFTEGRLKKPPLPNVTTSSDFQIYSDDFANNGTIPNRYTCVANNLSPELTFKNIPKNTKSLALIMHDLDAPGGDFTQWLVWNIPPTTTGFSEDSLPVGAIQGTNDFGDQRYGGPCPSSGVHEYVFDLYALNNTLNLPSSAHRTDVDNAIAGHNIAEASLNGIVSSQ